MSWWKNDFKLYAIHVTIYNIIQKALVFLFLMSHQEVKWIFSIFAYRSNASCCIIPRPLFIIPLNSSFLIWCWQNRTHIQWHFCFVLLSFKSTFQPYSPQGFKYITKRFITSADLTNVKFDQCTPDSNYSLSAVYNNIYGFSIWVISVVSHHDHKNLWCSQWIIGLNYVTQQE